MRLKQCCFVRRWYISDIILSSAMLLLGWCGEKLFYLISMFYSKYMFCRVFAVIQPDWMIYFATKSWCYISTTDFEQQLMQISVEAGGVRTCLGAKWEVCFTCVCQWVVLGILSCRCGCSSTAVLCSEFCGCIPVERSTGKRADHHVIAKRRHSHCRNVLNALEYALK